MQLYQEIGEKCCLIYYIKVYWDIFCYWLNIYIERNNNEFELKTRKKNAT